MNTQISKLSAINTMSSLEIASITGKSPSNINRDIRNMCEQLGYSDLNSNLIQGVTIVLNANNQTKEILLDKDHALTLITGYEAKIRMLVNKRWQELESAQSSFKLPDFNNPVEAARAWADEVEQKQIIQIERDHAILQIEADKPKVIFAEAVRNMQGSCLLGDFAKAIGIGRNRLFKKLRDDGILMQSNKPYQKYCDQGLFVISEQIAFTDANGVTHPSWTTRLTGKGQVWLENRYRKSNQLIKA